MKLRKLLLAVVAASVLLVASITSALAWDQYTDIFDWGRANQATKEQMVKDLQEILIKKKILNKRYTASSLVAMVEKRLAIDSEQAVILEEMCEGLKLNCGNLWD